MTELRAGGIRAVFDARTGLLESFAVTERGQTIAPLHRAPWVGSGETMPADAPPLMTTLGGDFFCAPFAATEGDSPFHGWPPNSPWEIVASKDCLLRAVLKRSVLNAALVKELALKDGHPFVYQRHAFIGGEGRVSFSNHANVSVKNGAFIRVSPKAMWETPCVPQESDPTRGRSAIIYPAQSEDPLRFPGRDGPVNLTRYPWNSRHEDFVVGIEAHGHALGWTAVTRPQEGDLYLSLRHTHEIPMTMLWHSNGGRDYAPWSGRHFGCLGVEEGAAAHMLGLSIEDCLTGPGELQLFSDGCVEVRHAIGAVAWPSGEPVSNIAYADGTLSLTGERGATKTIPFNGEFLRLVDRS